MTKYFLICASRDHVLKGVANGFAQAGHGKKDLMSKLSKSDWIVFYSAKDNFDNCKTLQKFTALDKSLMKNPINLVLTKTSNHTGEMWNLKNWMKQTFAHCLLIFHLSKIKKVGDFILSVVFGNLQRRTLKLYSTL